MTGSAGAASGTAAAPQTATAAPLANSPTAQTVARSTPVNLTLPSASLYHTLPTPNSRYLIETDPRFANYKTWLGSDYLLAALGNDPTTTLKRLGDGFYEQQLIREQIAQLASDIVWLVQQTVTLADGTLIAGDTLHLNATGNLVNSGSITGRNVSLQATTDIDNIGGNISGVDSLVLQAGRDLNVTTTTVTTTGTGSAGNGRQIDRLAGLYVTGASQDTPGLLLATRAS